MTAPPFQRLRPKPWHPRVLSLPVLSPPYPPSDPHANPVTSALKLYASQPFLSTSSNIISPPDSRKSPLTGLLAAALASAVHSPHSSQSAVLRHSAGHEPPVLKPSQDHVTQSETQSLPRPLGRDDLTALGLLPSVTWSAPGAHGPLPLLRHAGHASAQSLAFTIPSSQNVLSLRRLRACSTPPSSLYSNITLPRRLPRSLYVRYNPHPHCQSLSLQPALFFFTALTIT